MKCLFRGYTDKTFTKKTIQPEWLGFLGPLLRAEEQELLKITIKNKCTADITFEVKGTVNPDAKEGKMRHVHIMKNMTKIYSFQVENGPAENDGDSIMYLQNSHQPDKTGTYAGLAGPLIVTRKGKGQEDRSPKDVDKEFVLFFSVTNENESYLLDSNINTQLNKQAGSISSLKSNEDFQESNLMHGINGHLQGTLKGLKMNVGDTVRW